MMSGTRGFAAYALAAAALALGVTGCTASTPVSPPQPTPNAAGGPVRPVGTPKVLARGLAVPWSVVRLASGSALISERDAGVVMELEKDGTLREVGHVDGVAHQGEGGLLGLEVAGPQRQAVEASVGGNGSAAPDADKPATDAASAGDTSWLYAYLTTASDNRIVRMPLLGGAGSYRLGEQQEILTGLAKASNHDGGRLKIGPDGMLYATVGDATNTARAQNSRSLNGKILRMTLTGQVPSDNPTPDSLVYSMGHRNPQGLAWDADGQLWAAEFGQDTWDELNRIAPGGNYGWPTVEGIAKTKGFIDPVLQWKTSEASPSGLAYIDGTFFLAALRGERLWAIYPGSEFSAVPYFAGAYGRLRDAVAGPDGSLWLLTNNTDGRGSAKDGDDRLLQVKLGPLQEG